MKTEQLAMHSLTTAHRNLEVALDAYAAAGFRNVETYLPLVKAWMEDGHTASQTKDLFGSYGVRFIASSELAVECFHASDVLLSNLRANSQNTRLIGELGGRAMIVHTDGPERVTPGSLDPITRALVDLAEATEGTGVDILVEFNASPVVRSLQSAVRVAEIADHPRVGVLSDTAHRDFDRVLPGEGALDLTAIISALERGGYGGFLTIELFNADLWALPAAETARRCYQSLLPLCDG